MKKHVGGRIRAARKDAGLTQDQLAGMIDKSVETISNLERGHTAPSLETLGLVAKALEQPPDWFLRGSRDRRNSGAANALRTEIEILIARMNENELRQVADIVRIISRSK